MSDALNIRDIQTLTDLHAALGRFASGAQEALHQADVEVTRTQEWLRDRVNHWQREVEWIRREATRVEAN